MSPKLTAPPDSEEGLYARVRDLVVNVRQTVVRRLDLVQERANFENGWHIVDFEQQGADRAAYGGELLTALASLLSADFRKGFRAAILPICTGFTWLTSSVRQLSRQRLDNCQEMRGSAMLPNLLAYDAGRADTRRLFGLNFELQRLTAGVVGAWA